MLKISTKNIIIHPTEQGRLLFDTSSYQLCVASWHNAGLYEMDGMIGFSAVYSRPIENSLRKVNSFVGHICSLLFFRIIPLVVLIGCLDLVGAVHGAVNTASLTQRSTDSLKLIDGPPERLHRLLSIGDADALSLRRIGPGATV